MKQRIPEGMAGQRFDRVVAAVAGLSRAEARRLVEEGGVTLDGAGASPSQRVDAGAVVEWEEPEARPSLEAHAVPFDVLYEDPHLVVIDKPAGLVTHPGAGTRVPTLASGILHRWPQVEGVGDEGRWGLVHRLDKDTSGALLVALDDAAYRGLRDAIRTRSVERRYLALVHGTPQTPTGTIDAPIGPDPRRRGRRAVTPTGKPARTHYRAVATAGDMTLLVVTLESGRTHQIRVHLGSVGLPVAGDRTYGRPAGSRRTFLHAWSLSLAHPVLGSHLDAVAPLPDDLGEALEAAGIDPALGEAPAR